MNPSFSQPWSLCSLLVLGSALLLTPGCNNKAAPEPAGETSADAVGKSSTQSDPAKEQKAAEQKATAKKAASAPGKADPMLVDKQALLQEMLASRKAKLAATSAAAGITSHGSPGASKDPNTGEFSLANALEGLKGNSAKLKATIETDLGTLTCDLWPEKAPITVANFVGLARGTRAWKSGGKWVKKPLYDGTTFHRIIKGFMIQGGDPNGNGSGGPGYVIPDEIWEGAHHDKRGQICMANRGPNTNGSQFFIMDGAAKHLDGGYTIFGQCGPDELVEKLASTPMRGRKPAKAPVIKKISIQRG